MLRVEYISTPTGGMVRLKGEEDKEGWESFLCSVYRC